MYEEVVSEKHNKNIRYKKTETIYLKNRKQALV